ncbi:hypothetical protein [Clostridium sp. BJN0013]|uniref:hypothetical protein n=1 Tax=Clostridium sp. BJN0013 TaxID=3236840 RepID=UPI0034C6A889
MTNLRKLSKRQEEVLRDMGKNPKDYLRFSQDMESFTPVDVKTKKVLKAIRY